MLFHRSAQNGRLRHGLVEPGLAAFAAFLLISAAQAALPTHLPALTEVERTPVSKPAPPQPPPALVTFIEPVTGYPVISPFGLRRLPWENHGRLHEGVDIAAPNGHPIVASADGVVTRAGESPTYGRFVEVQHVEGLVSFYAHMGAIDPTIRSGVAVKSGTRIGSIGDSGTSTGPHLHFEVRDADDRPLNPQAFLNRSFANAEALPISEAARVSGRVRLAYVSRIPESKRELMEAKDKKKGAGKAVESPLPPQGSWMQARLDDRARVRAQIRVIAQEQKKAEAVAPPPAAPASTTVAAPAASDLGTPASTVAPAAVPVIVPAPAPESSG